MCPSRSLGISVMWKEVSLIESVWKKYLPPRSDLLYSEYSGIYFVREVNNGAEIFSTLDRVAQLAKNKNGVVSAYGRHFKMTKKDAETISNGLKEQAKRLEELSNSYKLLALAISISAENITDIINSDPLLKKEMENPF